MSKSTGYALHRDEHRNLAVAVAPTGPQTWRLTGWQETAAHRPLTGDLARALSRHGDRTAALLPAAEVTCTVTGMPRLGRRELARAAAGWVARKEGGAPAAWQVFWRAAPDPRGEGEQQDVFLAYAPRTVVDAAVHQAAALGARPAVLLPPPLVLDQLFRLAGPDHDELRVWNLVFVGKTGSFLCVANHHSLLLSRPLPHDLSVGTDPEEYLDRLVTEVERSVFFARQSEGSPEVDRVVVCGEASVAARLTERLEEEAGRTAVHWDLAAVIDPAGQEVAADDQLLLAAAALAGAGAPINLAPAATRPLLGPVARRRVLVGVATAAVTALPLLLAGAVLTDQVQQRFLDGARERLTAATVQAEMAAEIYDRERLLRAREDHVAAYLEERRDLAGALRHIAGLTPPEVRYQDLQLVRRADLLLLHLTGESTAGTLAAAQRAFMDFHAAMAEARQLRPLGEPRELEIIEVDQDGRRRKTVRFAVDYELVVRADMEES